MKDLSELEKAAIHWHVQTVCEKNPEVSASRLQEGLMSDGESLGPVVAAYKKHLEASNGIGSRPGRTPPSS